MKRLLTLAELIHWLSRGKRFPHRLEGGRCPLCGRTYDYAPDGGYWPDAVQGWGQPPKHRPPLLVRQQGEIR